MAWRAMGLGYYRGRPNGEEGDASPRVPMRALSPSHVRHVRPSISLPETEDAFQVTSRWTFALDLQAQKSNSSLFSVCGRASRAPATHAPNRMTARLTSLAGSHRETSGLVRHSNFNELGCLTPDAVDGSREISPLVSHPVYLR